MCCSKISKELEAWAVLETVNCRPSKMISVKLYLCSLAYKELPQPSGLLLSIPSIATHFMRLLCKWKNFLHWDESRSPPPPPLWERSACIFTRNICIGVINSWWSKKYSRVQSITFSILQRLQSCARLLGNKSRWTQWVNMHRILKRFLLFPNLQSLFSTS